MLSPTEQLRYDRHLRLEGFGLAAQQCLKAARVLVVGAGGLGCPALQYLAAAGVGTIGIVDGDTISVSNLQRQPLYTPADIGKSKAMVAAIRLKAFNPLIHYQVHNCFLTVENALELLAGYDLIIDGSDSFATRYLVNDACVMLDKPFVYGAIHRFEGQIAVFNYQGSATYRCLFPDPPLPQDMPPCSEVGVLGVLPALVGSWQAAEAIKLLTGVGSPLINTLLCVDLLSNHIQQYQIQPQAANRQITHLQHLAYDCQLLVRSISPADFLCWQAEHKSFHLLDVRTPSEYQQHNIGGVLCPLSELPGCFVPPSNTRAVVLLCQSGKRAAQAALLLQNRYPEYDFRVLDGGLNALLAYNNQPRHDNTAQQGQH